MLLVKSSGSLLRSSSGVLILDESKTLKVSAPNCNVQRINGSPYDWFSWGSDRTMYWDSVSKIWRVDTFQLWYLGRYSGQGYGYGTGYIYPYAAGGATKIKLKIVIGFYATQGGPAYHSTGVYYRSALTITGSYTWESSSSHQYCPATYADPVSVANP